MAGLGLYYKRDLEEEIIKYLPVKETIAIVEVRQNYSNEKNNRKFKVQLSK